MQSTALPARPEGLAILATLLAAVFWGTNFEATRLVLLDLPPWTAAALRFSLATVIILVWLAVSRGIDGRVLRRNALAFTLLGLIGITGFNAALFLGMRTSSPVTAALIMGTSPLTTNLLDAALRWQRPSPAALIGMGISLIGVALTVGAFSGAHFAPGDLLIGGGSLALALYTIGCRRLVKGATPLETSAWTMFTGTVVLVALALRIEHPMQALAQASALSWIASLHMALFGSALAFAFWQQGIAVRGPAATAVLFNVVPGSALAVAALFGRIPGWSQLAGVAIAILGVLIASGQLRLRRRLPG